MANHFNWQFPQPNETMFMATIQSPKPLYSTSRQSSFLKNDIPGAQNKLLIPISVHRENYANSAYIEPKPQSHIIIKNKFIETNNLRTRDIEGAYPQCNSFITNRSVNPLIPKYSLPSANPVLPQPPRKFLRNTLDITDISSKKQPKIINQVKQQPYIEGSSPKKLFRSLDAKSRLEVRDINEDGIFRSSRLTNPTNPLQPTYTWRDNRKTINKQYGDIANRPKQVIPSKVNKRNDLSLSTNDIEGARANSSNEIKYFFNARRNYRDSLNTEDIGKTQASSLKKGITTKRIVNPLVPQYNYINY